MSKFISVAALLASADFAKPLRLVDAPDTETEPTTAPELPNDGGGTEGDAPKPEEAPKEEPVAASAPFVLSVAVSDEIPDDLPTRASKSGEKIDWGFGDWAKGAHAMIPARLVERARGSLSQARLNKDGKPNGKTFVSFLISGNEKAKERNPGWQKGDIEVWRTV